MSGAIARVLRFLVPGRETGSSMRFIVRGVGALVLGLVLCWSRSADACGCLAPPSPAEPIVQAGERILFAVQNGVVTAHIQVQYAGDAKDFGWLLPLPSVPTLTVGTDELFNQLAIATDPSYVVKQNFTGEGCPPPPLFSCGCYAPVALIERTQGNTQDAGSNSALVTRSSVGPYDYAVLRADDQAEMLQWLADNRFYVPTGTDSAVGPYIRPGSYFLALKLKAGASTGDITPVVVKYPSSLPMIPIILTRVGAQPNMGVLVYLLGNGRGIPRNYHHVVLNDALVDWFGGATNYGALVTRAVAEAPQRHAFVTDYAGPSSVMKDKLAAPGRFGTEADFAASPTPREFLNLLFNSDYADPTFMPPALPAPVVRVLLTQIPVPDQLTAQGVTPSQFFSNFGAYNLSNYPGYMTTFDAPSLARKLFAEFVTPVREANALFTEFPLLTRLYTTLSPEDMTEDPVFSFNPDLPEVQRTRTATFTAGCGPGQLETAQGWQFENVSSGAGPSTLDSPAALRVEVLSEEGQPTVVTDNQEAIHAVFQHVGDKANPPGPQQGCSTVDPLSLGIFAVMFLRRRSSAR